MSPKDRDVYTDKHTPPAGVPSFVDEECTGRYEDDELRQARAKRPTDERISRLEDKHDSLVRVVTETRVEVGKMSGKLDILPKLVDAIQHSQQTQQADALDERKNKRERLTKIIGGLFSAGVLGAILARLL